MARSVFAETTPCKVANATPVRWARVVLEVLAEACGAGGAGGAACGFGRPSVFCCLRGGFGGASPPPLPPRPRPPPRRRRFWPLPPRPRPPPPLPLLLSIAARLCASTARLLLVMAAASCQFYRKSSVFCVFSGCWLWCYDANVKSASREYNKAQSQFFANAGRPSIVSQDGTCPKVAPLAWMLSSTCISIAQKRPAKHVTTAATQRQQTPARN